jgi:hypothetical protein
VPHEQAASEAQTDKEEMRVHAGTGIAANSEAPSRPSIRLANRCRKMTLISTESDRRMSASPHSNSVSEAAAQGAGERLGQSAARTGRNAHPTFSVNTDARNLPIA